MATISLNDSSFSSLETPRTPFENIGLAFSGGGFRAASFCLGTLTFLNNLEWGDGNLLGNVSYISSASGGTITNAMYALSMAQGDSFNTFYKKIFARLQGTGLLTHVLEILNNKNEWKDHKDKHRNIINAFSIGYDRLLFDGKLLSNLKTDDPLNPLDEVCFNTTDFYRGLLFRQNIKMKHDKPENEFLYGNYILNLNHHTAAKIKLGDALASSACFPAGFEPIAFPSDFAHAGLTTKDIRDNIHIDLQELKETELEFVYDKNDIQAAKKKLPSGFTVQQLKSLMEELPVSENFETGFMDGGIDDNQGIESIMRANDRRIRKTTNFKEFDLMLINDVASHFMDPYAPSLNAKKFFSLLKLFWICIGTSLAALAGMIACFYICFSWCSVLLNVLCSVFFVVPIAVIFLLWKTRSLVKNKLKIGDNLNLRKNFSESIADTFLSYLSKTPITVIFNLLSDRANSVLTLNLNVFLKRIRYLLYNQFLDAGRKTFRVKTNHVYDLAFSNDTNRLENSNDPTAYAPSTNIQIVSQCAFEMGTTLWFDDPEDCNQAALIACGQFTTCYNLLIYISRMKKGAPSYFSELGEEFQNKINKLETTLNDYYSKFKGDPFYLYNSLGVDVFGNEFKKKTMAQYSAPKEFKRLRSDLGQ